MSAPPWLSQNSNTPRHPASAQHTSQPPPLLVYPSGQVYIMPSSGPQVAYALVPIRNVQYQQDYPMPSQNLEATTNNAHYPNIGYPNYNQPVYMTNFVNRSNTETPNDQLRPNQVHMQPRICPTNNITYPANLQQNTSVDNMRPRIALIQGGLRATLEQRNDNSSIQRMILSNPHQYVANNGNIVFTQNNKPSTNVVTNNLRGLVAVNNIQQTVNLNQQGQHNIPQYNVIPISTQISCAGHVRQQIANLQSVNTADIVHNDMDMKKSPEINSLINMMNHNNSQIAHKLNEKSEMNVPNNLHLQENKIENMITESAHYVDGIHCIPQHASGRYQKRDMPSLEPIMVNSNWPTDKVSRNIQNIERLHLKYFPSSVPENVSNYRRNQKIHDNDNLASHKVENMQENYGNVGNPNEFDKSVIVTNNKQHISDTAVTITPITNSENHHHISSPNTFQCPITIIPISGSKQTKKDMSTQKDFRKHQLNTVKRDNLEEKADIIDNLVGKNKRNSFKKGKNFQNVTTVTTKTDVSTQKDTFAKTKQSNIVKMANIDAKTEKDNNEFTDNTVASFGNSKFSQLTMTSVATDRNKIATHGNNFVETQQCNFIDKDHINAITDEVYKAARHIIENSENGVGSIKKDYTKVATCKNKFNKEVTRNELKYDTAPLNNSEDTSKYVNEVGTLSLRTSNQPMDEFPKTYKSANQSSVHNCKIKHNNFTELKVKNEPATETSIQTNSKHMEYESTETPNIDKDFKLDILIKVLESKLETDFMNNLQDVNIDKTQVKKTSIKKETLSVGRESENNEKNSKSNNTGGMAEEVPSDQSIWIKDLGNLVSAKNSILTHVIDGYIIQEADVPFTIRDPLKDVINEIKTKKRIIGKTRKNNRRGKNVPSNARKYYTRQTANDIDKRGNAKRKKTIQIENDTASDIVKERKTKRTNVIQIEKDTASDIVKTGIAKRKVVIQNEKDTTDMDAEYNAEETKKMKIEECEKLVLPTVDRVILNNLSSTELQEYLPDICPCCKALLLDHEIDGVALTLATFQDLEKIGIHQEHARMLHEFARQHHLE